MPKPANRSTIAVDIDEVLVPFTEGLLEYHNSKYGSKTRFNEVLHHNFHEYWGISHDEYLRRGWAYITANHEKALPLKGAKSALNKLHKRYRIALITYRSAPLKDITLKWLKIHFNEIVDKPVFLGDKEGTGVHISTKAEVCGRINASYLIDDHLNPIIEASEVGIKGILFGDYPWNQAKKLPKNVTRAKDWQEVLDYFNEQ